MAVQIHGACLDSRRRPTTHQGVVPPIALLVKVLGEVFFSTMGG